MRILLAAVVAALALAVPGAADIATTPPSIPQFTGWISGANVILHWVPAIGAVKYELLRDGVVVRTVTSGTHEWLLPVKSARGHGFQVRALDAAGARGPATYQRLSPLPALRGLKLAAANSALRKAGFAPGTVLYYKAYGTKGVVMDVRARGVVALGWEVGFLVSK
jgi:hypothetical protein